ncbi:hypothetical protein FEM48_Zijuj01G0132700 [Ziziphus jujuba var. spinosa]|uniref:Late embryogenesis abundant protein LEA-2 subgroup domain-containing protein n=1 Tax=Ziziphus jujuba var. spinosa TaxID=714518 RepID=A0A978W1H0_ZIZJJ|nr:hypothetical protein FEM48_Zijuj01G0132700 [Ziziphus jujuba var. spinosa]
MCKNSESLTPIYFWFLQVLILWGALAAIILLSITPKSPIYTITDVRGNFSSLNQTSFIRNNSLIFNIEISNPNNRIGVYFDYIHMTLNHNGSTVGNEQHVPGFYQGFKWTTPCKVAVKADQKFLKWVAGGGTTELRVGLKTVVRKETDTICSHAEEIVSLKQTCGALGGLPSFGLNLVVFEPQIPPTTNMN